MSKTDKQILKLTEAIECLINKQVPPIPPIPAIPPIPPIPPIPQNPLDHDLLQRLDQKVDQIQEDVTILKNQNSIYVTKIDHAEAHKEITLIQNDHEARTRVLETNAVRTVTWGTAIIFFVAIIEFLVQKFL